MSQEPTPDPGCELCEHHAKQAYETAQLLEQAQRTLTGNRELMDGWRRRALRAEHQLEHQGATPAEAPQTVTKPQRTANRGGAQKAPKSAPPPSF